jgi:hypothetical protein
MSFYERGNVRIHYGEAGSGFPLTGVGNGRLRRKASNLIAFAMAE